MSGWLQLTPTQHQGAIEGLVQLGHPLNLEQGSAAAARDVAETCCEWCGAAVLSVGSAWRRTMTLTDVVASSNMVLQRLNAVNDLPLLPSEGLLLCIDCAPVVRGIIRYARFTS